MFFPFNSQKWKWERVSLVYEAWLPSFSPDFWSSESVLPNKKPLLCYAANAEFWYYVGAGRCCSQNFGIGGNINIFGPKVLMSKRKTLLCQALSHFIHSHGSNLIIPPPPTAQLLCTDPTTNPSPNRGSVLSRGYVNGAGLSDLNICGFICGLRVVHFCRIISVFY